MARLLMVVQIQGKQPGCYFEKKPRNGASSRRFCFVSDIVLLRKIEWVVHLRPLRIVILSWEYTTENRRSLEEIYCTAPVKMGPVSCFASMRAIFFSHSNVVLLKVLIGLENHAKFPSCSTNARVRRRCICNTAVTYFLCFCWRSFVCQLISGT